MNLRAILLRKKITQKRSSRNIMLQKTQDTFSLVPSQHLFKLKPFILIEKNNEVSIDCLINVLK